jgi:ABC-type molybdate transport system ATPase subunit
LTTLAFDGGELIVPHLDAAIRSRCARIRARDVSLATERPDGISILNILPGRVTTTEAQGGCVADVSLPSAARRSTRESRAVHFGNWTSMSGRMYMRWSVDILRTTGRG